MNVIINGSPHTLPDNLTLAQLIESLELEADTVVVEQNMIIVSRENLAATPVNEGDRLELIRFVGGG